MDVNRSEVNSPLSKEGKYLIDVLKVLVGLNSSAAIADNVLSRLKLSDWFGDQLSSVTKLPPL